MVSEVRMSARSDLLFSCRSLQSQLKRPASPEKQPKLWSSVSESLFSFFEERLFATLNVLILSNCECCPGHSLTLLRGEKNSCKVFLRLGLGGQWVGWGQCGFRFFWVILQLAQTLCSVFLCFRLFWIPPRERGWWGELVIECDDGGDWGCGEGGCHGRRRWCLQPFLSQCTMCPLTGHYPSTVCHHLDQTHTYTALFKLPLRQRVFVVRVLKITSDRWQ